MKIFICTLSMLLGCTALANGNMVRYGLDLCRVVTFQTSTQSACENYVIDNSASHNVYSLALNTCISFNRALTSSRVADCFQRAALWIPVQAVKDQVDLCEHRHGNYLGQSNCMKNLFFQKNIEANAEQTQTKQDTSSSSRAAR